MYPVQWEWIGKGGYIMNQVKLNFEKSKKIMKMTVEMKKFKRIGKMLLKAGKHLPPSEYEEIKKRSAFLINGANSALKDARRMHFIVPTTDLFNRLDECIRVADKERRVEEVFLHKLRTGA